MAPPHWRSGWRALLTSLRNLDVRLALDDFGEGYAGLSYLRQFDFDKVKFDAFSRLLPDNFDATCRGSPSAPDGRISLSKISINSAGVAKKAL